MSRLSRHSLGALVGIAALVVTLAAAVAPVQPARASVWASGRAAGPFDGGVTQVGGPGTQIGPWGGYIATVDTGTFAKATASWRIAEVQCSGEQWFSPWVGIDGYTNGTVEQTGVATICSGSTASYQAWYEMFPAPIVWHDDPVSVGDRFRATVTVTGNARAPRLFTLTLQDLTQGWTERVSKLSWTAQVSSAEAVIEGPGFYPAIKVQHFTDVRFNDRPLSGWHPVKSNTRSSEAGVIYRATPIRHGMDFTMKPKRS